ncbi:MAG: tRNA uridine-5-carboxymethylaminomethyl(34) synthesis enzyme MnmG [Ignavibacteria bacterium]|jgi:tRNA uridine 5-carboxymethylaminomethyl modification enzyme
MKYFDIVIVGGGHAGIEAAVSGAKLGCSVAMVTMDKNALGRMSCNPAIGGSAKGHLVHEIDCLGGAMGLIADKTGIQFRVLNKSKGPAVWAGRCQSDRKLYTEEAVRFINETEGVEVLEDSVIGVIVEEKKIIGAKTKSGNEINCKALVVCSGTFLNGLMYTGLNSTIGGRFGEESATGLTASLAELGFEYGRLKTGTPPRLKKDTIDFDVLAEQPGDENPESFSIRTDISKFPFLPQVSCHITYTDEEVHKVLRKGFDRSPLFTGIINGAGPRYCPSIEDKIVRFADKPRHQLFVEPEGLDDPLIYLNGFSSSLPKEIQLEALHKIKGMENAEMVRPAYAVEYDYFPPYQIDLTMETKLIEGLYFAGQINGTSGYEEAGAQGQIAGINAALKIQKRGEFTLGRSDAYIGVLIDDLVGKSTNEPYRMFTSRAEHRLILRQDNADRRLMKKAFGIGLIDKTMIDELNEKERIIKESKKQFSEIKLKPSVVNSVLEKSGSTLLNNAETVYKIAKRPHVNLKDIVKKIDKEKYPIAEALLKNDKALEQVEIETKYEGYISRQHEMIAKMNKLEKVRIPENFDFQNIKTISLEGREKLHKIKPRSIGQASRISGVSPSDISILLVYLKN